MYFPYDLGPCSYVREIKIYVHTKTCAQMYMAALFIITPN